MLTRAKECLWWKVSFSTFVFQGKIHSPSVDLKARPSIFFRDRHHLSLKGHVFSTKHTKPQVSYFSSQSSSRDTYSLFISLLSSSPHKVTAVDRGLSLLFSALFLGPKTKVWQVLNNYVFNKYFRLSWNQTVLPARRTPASSVADNPRRRYCEEAPSSSHQLHSYLSLWL